MTFDKIILTSAYLAPIQYYSLYYYHIPVFIENAEHYTKQSYRNRTVIYTANGIHPLVIPVIKNSGQKTDIRDIRIDYSIAWQKNHFMAILSAYKNAAFFEHFIDELHSCIFTGEKFLFDFTLRIHKHVLQWLGLPEKIFFTNQYIKSYNAGVLDMRNVIQPKSNSQKTDHFFHNKPYFQVFADRHGFYPGISVIDLLFNLGSLNAIEYLSDHRQSFN